MTAKIKLVPVFFLIALLCGCAKATNTPEKLFTWNIQIMQVEIKSVLKTTEIVTLYNGDKSEIDHENVPSQGNVFVILNLSVDKIGSETSSFESMDMVVMDTKGNSNQRLENDSFIEQHNFSPRMTGLPIRFGETKGWICFEVPQTAVDGKLFLVYTSSEGQQKYEIEN